MNYWLYINTHHLCTTKNNTLNSLGDFKNRNANTAPPPNSFKLPKILLNNEEVSMLYLLTILKIV